MEEAGDWKWKAVYMIVEQAGRSGAPDRKVWVRCGTVFPNRDGSLNIKLDALPTNRMLLVRDPMPSDGEKT